MAQKTIITGSGCYIPTEIISNRDFTIHNFYAEDHKRIETPPQEVVEKFKQITGIEERRYAPCELNASDIAAIAAEAAIKDSGIDPETLDQIIVAHNFGNVVKHTIQTDAVPSIASRVKHKLRIENPHCVAFDILFGCPGWVQGVIQADAFFKAGMAKRALVIGAETLSRVIDKYDRDSMIFSDGAGACVIESISDEDVESGILASTAVSHCMDEAYFIFMGQSNFPGSDPRVRYIKMHGRKVYEYAIKKVAEAMKECLEKANISIEKLKMVFIHQANEKMDEGIIRTLYKLYGLRDVPANVMPMCIQWLGNSSVATVPTLYDLVRKGQVADHHLEKGDIILFASVGAGMNINAICYRV
ncbi:MAG TPA: 3-oxoacyl-ACP synthase III family protein [Flavisolibacter sp.]|nr:3-oxoacyl-ACP synthase III family protein [Flavisolibacter sp.]